MLLTLAPPLAAQHAFADGNAFDPNVPSPRGVLGHEIGERFTPHHLIVRYLERLAVASRRIRVDTVARTFEGREVLMAIVTSETNQGRLDQILADAARIANPQGAPPAQVAQAAARLPAIVWLGFTVHGGEASGTEAALALLYQLAAGRDAETQMILDSVVALIDPVENPDGHERHVQDVARARGALGVPVLPGAMVHQGSWPGPRTSHYYFDLNRDWFSLSHPETRGRIDAFVRWWPHVAVDLHEMGSSATYFFAPPMEPINKNVHASIVRWWDIFAAANAQAFDRHGWSFFRRENYDEFYPGYGDSWPILMGSVGMTYEAASSSGGAVRRNDGTVLTLHDAAWRHYTAAWATLLTTARRARERVRDFLDFRRSAITDGEKGPLRAVVMERDGHGRADSLVQRLLENRVVVQRLRAAVDARDATPYGEPAPAAGQAARFPAGAYVVDFAQPQGRLAKALLEPDAELDSNFIRDELERRRTAQPDRFYDVTAWSLPYLFRIRAWWTRAPVGPLEPATLPASAAAPPAAPAQYGYAFEPGSESGIRLLAALLVDSVRVWYAPRAFRVGDARFPRGGFVVRVAMNPPGVHETVQRLAAKSGAQVTPLRTALADEGTDLGSNSVFPVKPPRIGLVGGSPVSGNSFGFAWYAFDQRLGYPVTTVSLTALEGATLEELQVLVVPSASGADLDRVLGDSGRARIQSWVRRGGVLVTLDGATGWLATERLGLARLRLRRDTTRADSTGGAPLPANIPGAIVRATADTLSPLLAGIFQTEFPVMVNSDRVFTVPKDLKAG
ncbi:MAG: hypothetical protein HY560_00860, partial [Gemmatimonadetes bacterium]|nr:hypothetical protein [Gemmatimonadota bacterium]